MSIVPILRFGDPRLTVVCDRVDLQRNTDSDCVPTYHVPDDVKSLVADLRATMYDANGAGIAAPQIGITRRVALFGTGAPNPRYPGAAIVPKMALVNPLSIPLSRAEFDALHKLELLPEGHADSPSPTAANAVDIGAAQTVDDEAIARKAVDLLTAVDTALTVEDALRAETAVVSFATERSAVLGARAPNNARKAVSDVDSIDYMTGFEGCLSVPGLRGVVTRHRFIIYQGICADSGVRQRRAACDFHARVFQHECDHLDGFVFPMRVADWSKFGYTEELVERGLLPALSAPSK